jgi:hypothetical protein
MLPDVEDGCFEVTGPTVAYDTYWTAACQNGGGSAVGACPATGRVGRCTMALQGVTVVFHFYPPTYDATEGTACVQAGYTWAPN